jgi:hypothetical protein
MTSRYSCAICARDCLAGTPRSPAPDVIAIRDWRDDSGHHSPPLLRIIRRVIATLRMKQVSWRTTGCAPEVAVKTLHESPRTKKRGVNRPYRYLYHDLMKTTLNLSDDFVAQAKAVATKERITLTKMIEEGLVLRLRRQRNRSSRKLKDLPVSSCRGGLRPGIDGTSNQSLFDAADA